MKHLPNSDLIDTEEALEERLSRPNVADVMDMAALSGDILILGAGGKMGPSLARLALRAVREAGTSKRIIAVARFSNEKLAAELGSQGIECLRCDLLEPAALAKLPECENVVFMAARKFGTAGAAELTWAMNTYLPGRVAERFRDSRIVAFSTGNIYGLRVAAQGGSVESSPLAPSGEYAQSVLGRERMFTYGSNKWGTKVVILRLNYAVELRYGVMLDIALAVYRNQPVNLGMGLVNIIWQRDANSTCLRSFAHCQSPPLLLNLTGPETLSVRYLAHEFGRRFEIEPTFIGEETTSALLNNATEAHRRFGYPTVTPPQLMDWVAHWVSSNRALLNKPTHFEVRDGSF